MINTDFLENLPNEYKACVKSILIKKTLKRFGKIQFKIFKNLSILSF